MEKKKYDFIAISPVLISDTNQKRSSENPDPHPSSPACKDNKISRAIIIRI